MADFATVPAHRINFGCATAGLRRVTATCHRRRPSRSASTAGSFRCEHRSKRAFARRTAVPIMVIGDNVVRVPHLQDHMRIPTDV